MFEAFYAGSQIFRDNILFLRRLRLENVIGHLIRGEKEREHHAMQITQEQLDKLHADDQALGVAVAGAVSRSQDAQKSAQDTAAQLASARQQLTTLQTELTTAGVGADLSGILADIEGAAASVGQIDATLAPTTGTAPVPAPPIIASGEATSGAATGTADQTPTGNAATEEPAPAGASAS